MPTQSGAPAWIYGIPVDRQQEERDRERRCARKRPLICRSLLQRVVIAARG